MAALRCHSKKVRATLIVHEVKRIGKIAVLRESASR